MARSATTRKKLAPYRGVKGTRRPPARVIRKANRKREPSSFELAVYQILKEEKIPFVKEKTIGRLHTDIFLEPRTVIELNGCYWHGHKACNVKFSKMQLEAHEKDARRYAFLQRLGFKVHVLWECEFNHDPEKAREQLKQIAAKA